MFNDKYGLTKAVLEGRKTQTRRLVKDVNLIQYLSELEEDDALKGIRGKIEVESVESTILKNTKSLDSDISKLIDDNFLDLV